MRSYSNGQSMVEYTCIGALVLCVCIMPFTSLGNTISGLFSQLLPQSLPENSTLSVSSPPTSEPPNVLTSLDQEKTSPTSGNLSSLLAGLANEMRYPSDFKSVVQTTGGNGVTQMLAAQLYQVGEHLLAKGEITQAQANAFYTLANQGNEIATIEKLVEEAYRSGSTSVVYQGTTYTPFDLSRKVGWINDQTAQYPFNVNEPNIDEALNRAPSNRSETLQSFLEKYQALEASGAMNNPQVKQTVGLLTTQIAYLSEVMEYTAGNIQAGQSPQIVEGNFISSTTYWKADQICGAGAGQTTGVVCQ